jgi:hypothetical protein
MARAIAPHVQILAVAALRLAKGNGQRIGPLGYNNQMQVVGHQAIADNPDSAAEQLILQQLQVVQAILASKKDVAAVDPALGDVARDSRHHAPGLSGHSNV